MTAQAEAAAPPVTDPFPARWTGVAPPTQLLILTSRAVRAQLANPRALVLNLLQPVFMLLLLSQVFGVIVDRSHLPGDLPYIDFLLPALLVTTGIGPAVASGIGLVRDMQNGVVSRLRTLPVNAATLLFARSFSDLLRTALQLVVLVLCAVLFFGADPGGGPIGLLAALLLTCFVIWALTWIFLALAAWLRNAEALQSAGFLVTFPLMFASSAFVPTDRLPGWLQALATVNPLTYAMDAARGLALDLPVGNRIWLALGMSLLVAVAGATVAVRGFRRPLI